MKVETRVRFVALVGLVVIAACGLASSVEEAQTTDVATSGESWLINRAPTNAGSAAEGLLLNSRMVQATFEDRNPETIQYWAYPDGSEFDPERQTDEFIEMVPTYAAHGLNAVTVSLQGGRPRHGRQVWINSAFESNGNLRPSYLERVARVIEALDRHGMVAIVSYFYFGQDQNFDDEDAIFNATRNATSWLLEQGYANVVVEIVNEAGHSDYAFDVLGRPDGVHGGRVHELISEARAIGGDSLLLSASLGGGYMPPESLIEVSDFHLLHGNNQDARRVAEMVDELRENPAYGGEPIVFNEDSTNLDNMRAAIERGASWGYYDQGDNDYYTGFQSPPTDWSINTPEKRDFFDLVQRLTDPDGTD